MSLKKHKFTLNITLILFETLQRKRTKLLSVLTWNFG